MLIFLFLALKGHRPMQGPYGAAPFVSVIDFITTSKKHTTGVKEHTGNNYSDYGLNYDLNYGLGYG